MIRGYRRFSPISSKRSTFETLYVNTRLTVVGISRETTDKGRPVFVLTVCPKDLKLFLLPLNSNVPNSLSWISGLCSTYATGFPCRLGSIISFPKLGVSRNHNRLTSSVRIFNLSTRSEMTKWNTNIHLLEVQTTFLHTYLVGEFSVP